MSSSNPAVPNKPMVDFAVTSLSERLRKNDAIMATIHAMTAMPIKPVMIGHKLVKSKLFIAFGSGVRFCKPAQSPGVQLGKICTSKSVALDRRIVKASTAMTTAPMMPTSIPIIAFVKIPGSL